MQFTVTAGAFRNPQRLGDTSRKRIASLIKCQSSRIVGRYRSMTASGIVSFFGICRRAMAERSSPALVVPITSPASIPQA